jgi:hypothetical protein
VAHAAAFGSQSFDAEQRAVRSLSDDLAYGRWLERNQQLMSLEAADIGARLLVA